MSQNNRSKLSNKKYHSRKSNFGKAKKEVPKERIDTRGFWEHHESQKKFKPTEESNIKKKLRMLGGYNPSRTMDYINPPLSKEEVIQKKLDNGESINSREKIIITSHNEKLERALAKDLDSLNKFSLNANVTTDEGRKRKLLKSLEYVIKKGDKKYDMFNLSKLKDNSFTLSDSLRTEFSNILNKMESVVADSDLVKLQMTELHSSQPPLDQKGFTKLDDFQIEVINNVNNNKSTIVSAPTSSGKSIISGYTFTKGKNFSNCSYRCSSLANVFIYW